MATFSIPCPIKDCTATLTAEIVLGERVGRSVPATIAFDAQAFEEHIAEHIG